MLFGAAALLVACNADREDFISPIGDVILNFPIGVNTPDVLPAGSGDIDVIGVVGFDTSGEDAFARATGPLGLYETIETSFGPAMGFNIGLAVRNDDTDPRLPALVDSDAAVGGFFGLFNPAWTGVAPGWWDLFGELTGLAPSTTYTVAVARMSLTVNGDLDTEEILLTGMATDPDELAYLGGTESGSPAVTCDFSAGVGVDASRNPVALGTVTTDVAGEVTVDCLPVAINDSPWWRDFTTETPANAADSVPVGVNDTDANGGMVAPGQYNYVLLIEGVGDVANPVPDANPTVRIQIGPDIDAAGNVISNGFAPFPDGPGAPDDLLAAPGGANAQLAPTAVSFSVGNLSPLNGVYQLWLFNEEDGSVASPTGDITITNVDEMGMEVVVSSGMSNAFNPTDRTDAVSVALDDATAGVALGDFTHVFLSIESSAAGSPAAAQPLWAQYLDMEGMPGNSAAWTFIEEFDLPFGTFELGDDPRVFALSGFGEGAFAGSTLGVSDLFVARFRNLTIPPVGYYYEGFIRRLEDGEVASEVSTGDLTTDLIEGTVSLRDVDVDQSISPSISPTLIVISANRATLEDVGGAPFYSFDDYILRLRPKIATGNNGIPALTGLVPETVTEREPTP